MIVKTDQEQLQAYLQDESGLRGGSAIKILIPENEQEAAEALKECSEKGLPVTISAGGTGVTGGRVPFGGVVLSVERFNKISEIKARGPKDAVVTAGAGVSIKEIKEKAKTAGWMYAPDPTEQTSFLGGNISTNASGSRGLKFGPTRKYIMKMTVILSPGEIMRLERGRIFANNKGVIVLPLSKKPISLKLPSYKLPEIKNAAGYFNYPGMDLIDLFIGQDGTLGVITEAELLLVPKIQNILTGIAFFKEEIKSWEFVQEIKKLSALSRKACVSDDVDAMSLEYFDYGALELLREDYRDIPKGSHAAVFFEQAMEESSGGAVIDRWAKALETAGVPLESVWFGTTEREEKLFREFRHKLPEKVNEIVRRNKYPKTGTDLAVPDERLQEMISYYKAELDKSKIRYLIFGHIGESHMHANFLPESESEFKKSKAVYLTLAKKAVSLGGTVSAEHGIGKLKHSFLEVMVGKKGVKEMAELKKILDPAGILGRGNIFNEKLL